MHGAREVLYKKEKQQSRFLEIGRIVIANLRP